jgi:hypothetical protein
MQLDPVRRDPGLPVNLVPEADTGQSHTAAEIDKRCADTSADTLELGPRPLHRRLIELRAPLQRVYGNSTIMVFRGLLGTRMTTW